MYTLYVKVSVGDLDGEEAGKPTGSQAPCACRMQSQPWSKGDSWPESCEGLNRCLQIPGREPRTDQSKDTRLGEPVRLIVVPYRNVGQGLLSEVEMIQS